MLPSCLVLFCHVSPWFLRNHVIFWPFNSLKKQVELCLASEAIMQHLTQCRCQVDHPFWSQVPADFIKQILMITPIILEVPQAFNMKCYAFFLVKLNIVVNVLDGPFAYSTLQSKWKQRPKVTVCSLRNSVREFSICACQYPRTYKEASKAILLYC